MIDKNLTPKSAFFLTFNGCCKKALMLYQQCFGGELCINEIEIATQDSTIKPIVHASLSNKMFTMYTTDLVQNEGRKVGNNIAIFIQCSIEERFGYFTKISINKNICSSTQLSKQQLIEVEDEFGIRWMLGI